MTITFFKYVALVVLTVPAYWISDTYYIRPSLGVLYGVCVGIIWTYLTLKE